MKNYLFTSESVTEGHPDKVADCISDAILDAILSQDSESRVACETMITGAKDKQSLKVFISGEITSNANVDYAGIARRTLEKIGYLEECDIETLIKPQSKHIAQGVDSDDNHEQGAGDQGLMFGYACRETPELMPLPITLSQRLVEKLTYVRKQEILPWLKPDGKSQVTIEYDGNNNPVKIDKVVIATQHDDMINDFETEINENKFIKDKIIEYVIKPVLENYGLAYNENFLVNETGRFVEGGPVADVGLTGRKIIVDTYGGYARHGGGAFSGKDPSKVDRSAAYMTRYIAKNIVASKLADRCEVQVAYCIGVAKPMSVNVNTFNTGKLADNELIDIINEVFDLRPKQIISCLKLKNPIYKELAAYGHFGRNLDKCTWEKLDKVDQLSKYL
ncbi:MAG: methionine adenosyltransferase [Candidatus Marinimicrobia bacterium]|nr:methionine adenosyltransferase [Candidatus Neomarinimicrobiota bacterium]|tara:strand:- start:18815 stop:19987 length:1173 start_codon:yes stop_codon:yes gene_type:complete